MRKTSLKVALSLLLFFMFAEPTYASEDHDVLLDDVPETEEYELLGIDIGDEIYTETTIIEEDGTETTISLTLLPPELNTIKALSELKNDGTSNVGINSLTPGKRYRYTYKKDKYTWYGYTIRVDNIPITITSITDLQYSWAPGVVTSTSTRRISQTSGRVQLVYNRTGTIKGSATETSNIYLFNTGRGTIQRMEVYRNNSTTPHIINDARYPSKP